MYRNACLFCALFVAFLNPCAFADIAAIHTSSLPQEAAVLDPLKDALQLEPYSHSWTQDWKYPVAKKDAAVRLSSDLKSLSSAVKIHPDNAELLLLTGLVARYAYNLDMEGSYDTSMTTLAEAAKLDPADIRAPWFRATLQCQTTQPKAGADEFLTIEGSHSWEGLPAAFWVDYMECATVTGMPAHVLQAGDRLEKLHAPATQMSAFLMGVAQKRFDPFDPKKAYADKEAWEGANTGKDTTLTSTSCGLRLHVQSDWGVDQLALTKGSCVADFSTGPYKGTAHSLRPSILVMVQQPEKGETLEAYSKRFQTKGTFAAFTPSRCPAEQCIAVKGIRPGGYGQDGDGHGWMVIFERSQPQFPGLVFESPWQIPKSDDSTGPKYYRPRQMQERIPGKLYYVVLLDTAASIEGPAMKDFESFLQQLTVE
jgi:hypothetical protein